MKTIILAGGRGSRISEETDVRPKPMIEIGGKPLLWHIMQIYLKYFNTEFIIATGYKADIIDEYIKKENFDFKVSTFYTGLDSGTGERIKLIFNSINEMNESFMRSLQPIQQLSHEIRECKNALDDIRDKFIPKFSIYTKVLYNEEIVEIVDIQLDIPDIYYIIQTHTHQLRVNEKEVKKLSSRYYQWYMNIQHLPD